MASLIDWAWYIRADGLPVQAAPKRGYGGWELFPLGRPSIGFVPPGCAIGLGLRLATVAETPDETRSGRVRREQRAIIAAEEVTT